MSELRSGDRFPSGDEASRQPGVVGPGLFPAVLLGLAVAGLGCSDPPATNNISFEHVDVVDMGSGPADAADAADVGDDGHGPQPRTEILHASAVGTSSGMGCAIAEETLWCWGRFAPGAPQTTPFRGGFPWGARPVELDFTAVSLTSDSQFLCALGAEGEAQCWGRNPLAETDFGSAAFSGRTFGRLVAGPTAVCGIENGDLWCWGASSLGLTVDAPTQIARGRTVDDVALVPGRGCAISEEALLCWGSGRFSIDQEDAPADDPFLLPLPFVPEQIARRRLGFVLLDGDGTAWELTFSSGEPPSVSPVTGLPPLVQLDGEWPACGVSDSGEVWCWDSDIRAVFSITRDTGSGPWRAPLDSAAAAVSVADSYACALLENGEVHCFGDGVLGQLGRSASLLTPTPVFEGRTFEQLSLGSQICGLTAAGEVFCNGRGLPPDPNRDQVELSRISVPALSAIRGDAGHTCGVTRNTEELYCWGYNALGALAVSDPDELGPVRVNLDGRVVAFETQAGTTCAYTDNGKLRCWGLYYSDGMSPRTTANQFGSLVEIPTTLQIEALALSTVTYCAMDSAGAHCWRSGFEPTDPDTVLSPPSSPEDVALRQLDGGSLVCGLDDAGKAYCWAIRYPDHAGISGQDPGDDGVSVMSPTLVSGVPASTQLEVSNNHACALASADQQVWCWGQNGWDDYTGGQLGDGTFEPHVQAAPVAGGRQFEHLAAGPGRTCALDAAGTAYCWGSNDDALLAPNHGPYAISIVVSP